VALDAPELSLIPPLALLIRIDVLLVVAPFDDSDTAVEVPPMLLVSDIPPLALEREIELLLVVAPSDDIETAVDVLPMLLAKDIPPFPLATEIALLLVLAPDNDSRIPVPAAMPLVTWIPPFALLITTESAAVVVADVDMSFTAPDDA
jgi:hypothetical protein